MAGEMAKRVERLEADMARRELERERRAPQPEMDPIRQMFADLGPTGLEKLLRHIDRNGGRLVPDR